MTTWFRRHRADLLLFAAATLWFLPGIWWGLPVAGRMQPWAPDELGPFGAVKAVLAVTRYEPTSLTPQYPLGHLFIQSIFVWPYQVAVMLADNLGFGLREPSIAVLTVLHRLPSVLLAAGTVVVARRLGRDLGGERAGWLAAAGVATIGPLVYYARTSNVDAGALFWSALAMLLALSAVRSGLTVRRAIAIALCAAIGTATKDQQYAFFLGLGAVLLATHLLDRRRAGSWPGWWIAPVAAVAAGAAAYLVLSGAVLLPDWFHWHLDFIRGSAKSELPADIQVLRGSYFSTPATLGGYAELAVEAGAIVAAAVSLPVLGLAAAGLVLTARRDRRLLALLVVPALAIAAGVLGPVRFVRPRFLLPVDFIAWAFAAVAVGAAWRQANRWRGTVATAAALGILWTTLRGADLTFQMVEDGRYQAAEWIARNVHASDTVGYFGAPGKLPLMPAEVVVTSAPGQMIYERKPASRAPAFIISIPQQPTEPIHEWSVADSTFARLIDGSGGYRQVYAGQTAAIWQRPPRTASYVNPPIRIFARNDILARLGDQVHVELADPAIPGAAIEEALDPPPQRFLNR